MDTIKAMTERRAVRKYSDKKVKMDYVADLIETAKFAPSSGNVQNWRIIVVEDETIKEDIAIACLKQKWMVQAPVFLVICDEKINVKRLFGKRGVELYSIQNCAALTQNILLAAKDYGIDSCWVSAFDEDAVSRILKIPDGFVPEAIITLGYRKDKEIKAPNRINIKEIVYLNQFGNKAKDLSFFPVEKQYKAMEDKGTKIKDKIKGIFNR